MPGFAIWKSKWRINCLRYQYHMLPSSNTPAISKMSYLKEYLVQFHECDGFTHAAITTVTECQLDLTFHLDPCGFVCLEEPFRAKYVHVVPKYVAGLQQSRDVHPNCGACREEISQDCFTRLGDCLGI